MMVCSADTVIGTAGRTAIAQHGLDDFRLELAVQRHFLQVAHTPFANHRRPAFEDARMLCRNGFLAEMPGKGLAIEQLHAGHARIRSRLLLHSNCSTRT
jgi:hypothetical protein